MQKIPKMPKYIPIVSKTKIKKKCFKFPQKKTSSSSKNGGGPKKKEKSLENFLNSKLSNLILNLELGTEVKGNN
jgi:hypothetical protein